jgi:allophanate hydrolase subunit 1
VETAVRRALREIRDGAVLVEYPEASEEEANEAAAVLGSRLRASAPRGLLDAIPGARNLLVLFDAARLRRTRLQPKSSPAGTRRRSTASPSSDSHRDSRI